MYYFILNREINLLYRLHNERVFIFDLNGFNIFHAKEVYAEFC